MSSPSPAEMKAGRNEARLISATASELIRKNQSVPITPLKSTARDALDLIREETERGRERERERERETETDGDRVTGCLNIKRPRLDAGEFSGSHRAG